MQCTKVFIIAITAIIGLNSCGRENAPSQQFNYPFTAEKTDFSVFHGDTVFNPYKWLDDDTAAEVKQWVKAQNEVTFGFLKNIPERKEIETELSKMWNYEKRTAPFSEGKYTYYYKNDGLQNQYILYQVKPDGSESAFLDPNKFSKEGTSSLSGVSFDAKGEYVAYGISEAGSDWKKIVIMHVESRRLIGDTIMNVKFGGITWLGQEGIFYSRYPDMNGSKLSMPTDQHLLMFHKLNTPQINDKVIFGRSEKRRYISAYTTEDEKYLIISTANATSGNELYIKNLTKPDAPIQPIITGFDSDQSVIDHRNDTLYIVTNRNAPNKKIVKTAISNPKPENWIDFIPEQSMTMSPTKGAGYYFIHLMKDANSEVWQYDTNGKPLMKLELPGLGTASGFSGKATDSVVYYTFTNYITPGDIYSYNPITHKSNLIFRPKVNFNTEEYETKQEFYKSNDGTSIPITICYKKGLKLDGNNPTMLYGYGGFNISLTPNFSVVNALWMKMGGVYAVPNLRGGGEYGKEWHLAGTKLNKKKVFEDFEAAAEYLFKQKYTRPEKLAISGRSNGGLLVGAVLTRRPDLCKVALPGVGVLDMLHYHKFTAGAGWAYDYGTADEDREMFEYLKSYSPVHNVDCSKSYPAILITTGDHDDRVVPSHSYKFAATLQKCASQKMPVLLRVDVNTGHGAGKPVSKTIAEYADMLSFAKYFLTQ
jgi:prolyl oligopeptidase